MLPIQSKAPLFEFINQHGKKLHLSDFIGQKIIVLYFYPKDFTPGCTAQACGFRDEYEEFVEHGAEVIGISGDSNDSHAQFSTRFSLPFHLATDVDGSIRRMYDVPTGFFGVLFSRITYIIDLNGNIAWAYKSNLAPKSHVPEALKVIKSIVQSPVK